MTIGRRQCLVNGFRQYNIGNGQSNSRPMESDFLKREDRRKSDEWKCRVGAGLRTARDRAGMTQVEAANLAGLDWTTISQIENGASAPDLATIETLADVLHADLDSITGRSRSQSVGDYRVEFEDGGVLTLDAYFDARESSRTIKSVEAILSRAVLSAFQRPESPSKASVVRHGDGIKLGRPPSVTGIEATATVAQVQSAQTFVLSELQSLRDRLAALEADGESHGERPD